MFIILYTVFPSYLFFLVCIYGWINGIICGKNLETEQSSERERESKRERKGNERTV